MDDVQELIKKYGSGGNNAETKDSVIDTDIQTLIDKYGGLGNVTIQKIEKPPVARTTQDITQGVTDVLAAGGSVIGAIDKAVIPGGSDRSQRFDDIIKEKNKKFEKEHGGSDSSIGRTIGQIAATTPLVPSRLLQATEFAMGAAPTITSTGTRVLAPAINRAGANVVKGALGGGVYGAATTTANDKGLISNVEEGLISGAIGAPIIAGGSVLAGKTIQSARNLWASIDINKIANGSGLPASSVKKIIGHLENVGFTPQQAQSELNALGPKATLMDLDDALSATGRGLTTMGEKPRSIMSGRMQQRAAGANSEVVQQLETALGPRPKVYFERGKAKGEDIEDIRKAAKLSTAFDYDKAHSSKDVLPTQAIVSAIDSSLESAVGRKASVLKDIKGYFFNDKNQLKTSVKDLHIIRQEVDDILEKKAEGLGGNAAREIGTIREGIDALLKNNPAMAAADAKYAEKMKKIEAIQFGYNVINKGMNRDEFAKIFAGSSADIQDAIKKGQYSAIREKLDMSEQGELSGASRLFSKKAVNRANFKTAFGKDADEILNSVHRDITFRDTERRVMHGSDTAQNQAFQQEYGLRPKPPGAFGEGVKSAVYDVVAGTPGVAAAMGGVRTGIKNRLAKYSENNLAQTIEGSADILSRSGNQADVALGIAQRIKDRMDGAKKLTLMSVVRLPVSSSAPVGDEAYDKGEGTYKLGKKFFKHIFGERP